MEINFSPGYVFRLDGEEPILYTESIPDLRDGIKNRRETMPLGQLKAKKMQSFQMRLILSAMACILIPSIISYSMSNFLAENKFRERALGNANQTLQAVDHSVSNLFKFMLYIENYIMLDDAEIGYVLKNRALGLDNTESGFSKYYDTQLVINKLDLLSVAGERCKITIILPNNQYFTNYGMEELDPADWEKEPWFAELKNMKGFDTNWISVEPTKFRKYRDSHPYQLSVARTLQTTSSKIYAYVIVTVFEDQVHSVFSNEDGSSEIMMVNDKGVIQSSSESELIGTSVDYVSNGSSIVVKNGRSYLFTERKLAYSDWKLISLTPYKEAISNITGIYSHVLIYQIMFFMIFLLVLIYLINKFTKPLRHLGKIAKTVYRGNLDVRSNIRGRDEIGMLGLSFDQMLESIKQMITQITYEQSKKREAELAMLCRHRSVLIFYSMC
ncbi:HAMP domain-containing protein [Paenibacillus sp. P25]|nr:HAMP domain-containing protein [Paenibacillus sp. P25]